MQTRCVVAEWCDGLPDLMMQCAVDLVWSDVADGSALPFTY